MNLRRGSTSSPMSILKIWSASTLSSTWHCLRNRVFGSMVVSFSCSGDISPKPLNRVIVTFFFRYMRPLIDAGHIFLAMPPLYKLKIGQKERYLFDENEKDKVMAEIEDKKNVAITRFKGLGEMSPEQLNDTTMNPKTRFLKQCHVEDSVLADQIFSMLMGEDVEPRRKFIETNAYKVLNDLDI